MRRHHRIVIETNTPEKWRFVDLESTMVFEWRVDNNYPDGGHFVEARDSHLEVNTPDPDPMPRRHEPNFHANYEAWMERRRARRLDATPDYGA